MNIRTLILLLAGLLTLSACGKDDDGSEPAGTAGKGGSAVLRITPKHHEQTIDSCTLYIKYNTSTGLQDVSKYDDSVKCTMENSIPVATFSGLKKGKYFIYGVGWDPFISKTVTGGVPYTVDSEMVLNVLVAVTEPGH